MDKRSIFTFVRNALSLGYPIFEALYSLRFLGDEIVIVDAGSTDGTREKLAELEENPNITVYDDEPWEDGLGGRNYRKSGNKCHELCKYDTIIFTEADEVSPEILTHNISYYLEVGENNLKFMRYQLTQNFQKVVWYPDPDQIVHRIFPKGSCLMVGATSDSADQAELVPFESGYIVDCRNNFRESFLARERASKVIWDDEGRETIRLVPPHVAQPWEIMVEEFEQRYHDPEWTWQTTPFKIPKIMEWHVGRVKYDINTNVFDTLKRWKVQ